MFHCLPSELLDEDVEVLRLLHVEKLGRDRAGRQSGPSGTEAMPETY